MANIYIIGSGVIGRAMAFDLARNHQVFLADSNQPSLDAVQFQNQSIQTKHLDVKNHQSLSQWVKQADIVMLAVPGFLGYEALRTILEARKNVVDISFSPENALNLSSFAKERGATAIVDAGVAPGIPNYLLGYYNTKIEINSFEYYVGGLPKYPKPPFNYKAPFSPIDVIEEYTRPARMMINGKIVVKPAMSDVEIIHFDPIGQLEAFNTDGLRSILNTMNHIPNMKEKTLRYPGHADVMKEFRDQGLFSESKIGKTSSDLFGEWHLDECEPEFTIMKILISGVENGVKKIINFNLYDEYDSETDTPSMSRTTGYTATATINMLLNDLWVKPGVFPPEIIGQNEDCFNFILDYLKQRNIQIIREK